MPIVEIICTLSVVGLILNGIRMFKTASQSEATTKGTDEPSAQSKLTAQLAREQAARLARLAIAQNSKELVRDTSSVVERTRFARRKTSMDYRKMGGNR